MPRKILLIREVVSFQRSAASSGASVSPDRPTTLLIEMLAQRSARRGDFVLSSGRRSNLYIDARLTTMSPDGLALIGSLGLTALQLNFGDVDAVGGLTLGADPVAYAIAYASATTEWPIRAFTVRKDAKAHGTGRQIEGPYQKGDRVVIIEDVITTGGSALRAMDVLRAGGATLMGVLTVVDRGEGGRELIESQGVRVVAHVKHPAWRGSLTNFDNIPAPRIPIRANQRHHKHDGECDGDKFGKNNPKAAHSDSLKSWHSSKLLRKQ